jgi:glyoxylase-like metal-dependent hydrolase (beta-lactamase superfamily II)
VSTDVYIDLARSHGWTIRHVLDTHVHADHLSRARQLAHRTEADLWLHRQDRVRFAFRPLAEGDSIAVGGATLVAMHTPGHTNESVSYTLDDAAVFTGDTLFVNGVGRPDLDADARAARQRAAALFASLHRLRTLDARIVVLPAHTSGPVAFDGRPIASTMGEVAAWLSEWLKTESAFVERVTSNLPPTPPNFARIVDINETGDFPSGDPTELEAGANRCAVR